MIHKKMLMKLLSACVVLTLLAGNAWAQCVTPPSGMVSWWPGDGAANDLMGSNHGTLQNGATFAAGMVGQAFSFDGANDYVEMPGGIGDFGSSTFTVDFWMYTASDPGAADAYLMGKSHPDGGLGWDIRFNDAAIKVVGVNGWGYNITSDASATLNAWHHIALSSTSSTVDLYIDGVLKGSSTRSAISATSNPFRIGYTTNFGGAVFNGLIDEVEIFSHALTAGEIQSIYNAGSAGKCKSCVTPPSNMVSWWPGDGDANDIQDGNNGTLMNGATIATGMVGQAFSFDGTDDYVSVPHNANLNMTTSLTIDAWVNPAGTGTGNGIIVMKNPLKYALVWLPSSQKITLSLDIGGWSDYLSSSSVPINQWSHIAGTYDGSSVRLFINGVLDAEFPKTGLIATSTGDLTIGRRTDSPAELFYGLIDEVEIFNRALTQAEIQAIYHAGSAGKCAPAVPNADLSVTKSDAPDPVTAGNDITYTVTITNNGPDPATGVVLADTLPAGVTFVSANSTQGSCAEAAGTVTCAIGDMGNGAVVTVTIVVRANTVGTIINTATATSTSTDPSATNNTTTATTTVQAVAGTTLPPPSGPTAIPGGGACAPLGFPQATDNVVTARPLGYLLSGDTFVLTLYLGPVAGFVDLYVVVQLPNGEQLILNNLKQFLPFPANQAPFIVNTLGPVAMTDIFSALFSAPMSAIPPGSYLAYLLMVPTGANPASFSLASSPYYLWCFTKTF